MGSQTRMAEALREHYEIDTERAWKLMRVLESVEIGDEISDEVYRATQGEVDSAVENLEKLRDRLSEMIRGVRMGFQGIERRL